jgi:hypothetical protein
MDIRYGYQEEIDRLKLRVVVLAKVVLALDPSSSKSFSKLMLSKIHTPQEWYNVIPFIFNYCHCEKRSEN